MQKKVRVCASYNLWRHTGGYRIYAKKNKVQCSKMRISQATRWFSLSAYNNFSDYSPPPPNPTLQK